MSPRAEPRSWFQPGSEQVAQSESLKSSQAEAALTLADLDVAERAQVIRLTCGRLEANRLVALGFTPGAEVGLTQNYGRGPLIVAVRGGRVALGRGEARCIHVERCAE